MQAEAKQSLKDSPDDQNRARAESIRELTRNGIKVFPIPLRDKKPIVSWTEYKTKTLTDEDIDKISGGNYGVICGESSGNLAVLDLDSESAVRRLEETSPDFFNGMFKVKTHRGCHIYFFAGKPIRTIKRETEYGGVEIRGEGSYVVGPYSVHPEGTVYMPETESFTIRHLNEKFVDEFVPTLFNIFGIPDVTVDTAGPASGDRYNLMVSNLPKCIDSIAGGVGEGLRNDAVFVLAAYLSKVVPNSEDLLLLWNQKNNPPLPVREVKSAYSSAEKYSIGCNGIRRRLTVPESYCETCTFKSFMKNIERAVEVDANVVSPTEIPLESADIEIQQNLPTFCTSLRPGQIEAITKIVETCGASLGSNILLSAQTGWGKTLVFTTASRIVNQPSIIIEPYKALQEQIAKSYRIPVMKGKTEYLCALYKDKNLKASEAPCSHVSPDSKTNEDKDSCPFYKQDKCEYYLAKGRANSTLMNDGILLVNQGNFWQFLSSANVVVFDEADKILDAITSPLELSSAITNKEDIMSLIQTESKYLENQLASLDHQLDMLDIGSKEYRQAMKQYNAVSNKMSKVKMYGDMVGGVYSYMKKGKVYVKLTEDKFLFTLLNKINDKTKIFVTATPPESLKSNPLVNKIDIDYSVATKTNAPIIYFPVELLTSRSVKQNPSALYTVSNCIKNIFGFYQTNGKTKKAVVHTGNIGMHGKTIARYLQPYSVILHEKGKLDETMRTFLNDDGYDFLLIASGDVGFDFSTNDITVQFIVKVPYPALDEEWRGYADRFGKSEMNAKYTEQTIHTIEQICGRTCRGEDDVGVTFILDSKFEDLYKKNEEMFSEKFKERMVWIK